MPLEYPAQAEGIFADLNRGGERRNPLRLQPQQNAGRLEDRRLPLAVRAKKKIGATGKFDGQIFKAAEIAQPQIGQHRNDGPPKLDVPSLTASFTARIMASIGGRCIPPREFCCDI
jgi:hypothetical protein